jgi:hypothetical protein
MRGGPQSNLCTSTITDLLCLICRVSLRDQSCKEVTYKEYIYWRKCIDCCVMGCDAVHYSTLKREAVGNSEMCSCTELHGVISQNTVIFMVTTVGTASLTTSSGLLLSE